MAMAQRFAPGRWREWWMALSRISPDAAGGAHAGDGATRDTEAGSFEEFIRQHERPVLNYVWRMLGDEQTAYDLTQETFVRAWQHFATIAHYDQPRAWLLRVASNLALSYLRRKGSPVGAAVAFDETNSPSTSDHARRLAERDLVRQVLDQMPARRRAALILREVYGMSCEQIGQALDMTADAVKTALCRAREQFRTIYQREER